MKTLHPATDREQVLAYLDGRLDPSSAASFDEHLCACRHCRWELRFSLDREGRLEADASLSGGSFAQLGERVRDAARRELARCMRELLQCCLLARDGAGTDILAPGRAADFVDVLEHAHSLGRRLRSVGVSIDLSSLPERLPDAGTALLEAHRVLDLLDTISGSSPWSDIARALLLRLSGRTDEALDLTRATLASCRHPRLAACAFVNLCAILLAEGRIEQALSAADAALARDGDDLLALAVSLSCLTSLGRRRAAHETGERFRRIERDQPSLAARRMYESARSARPPALSSPSPDDDLRVSRAATRSA